MTKKSDFKKIIRARMAKTGESYAAARAVLLAEGERRCQECGDRYSESTWLDSHYFNPPYDTSAAICGTAWHAGWVWVPGTSPPGNRRCRPLGGGAPVAQGMNQNELR